MGHITLTTPLLRVVFIHGLGLATINLSTKLEVSTLYDMKGDTNVENEVFR